MSPVPVLAARGVAARPRRGRPGRGGRLRRAPPRGAAATGPRREGLGCAGSGLVATAGRRTPVTGYAEGVLEALVADRGRAAVAAVPHPVALTPITHRGPGAAGASGAHAARADAAVVDAESGADGAAAPTTPPRPLMTQRPPCPARPWRPSRRRTGVWVPGWAATIAQAAAHAVAAERSAIVAVPDFRDVTDLERALLAVLPAERVVRFDAKQTNGQRAKALLQARSHAVVAIGNRAACTRAPAPTWGSSRCGRRRRLVRGTPRLVRPRARRRLVERRSPGQRSCSSRTPAAPTCSGSSSCTGCRRSHRTGSRRRRSSRPCSRSARRASRRRPGSRAPRGVPPARRASTVPSSCRSRVRASAPGWCAPSAANAPTAGSVAAHSGSRTAGRRSAGSAARWRSASGVRRAGTAPSSPSARGRSARPTNSGGRSPAPASWWRTAHGRSTRCPPGPRRRRDRGAEPSVAGGYACVLLLDGERMLAREGLRVQEDVLRFGRTRRRRRPGSRGLPRRHRWEARDGDGAVAARRPRARRTRGPPRAALPACRRVATLTGTDAAGTPGGRCPRGTT